MAPEQEGFDFDSEVSFEELVNSVTQSEAGRTSFLRASFIAAAIGHLRRARQELGLSQSDIAEKLETKQPAIARLEKGSDISLGRLWDYLNAVGRVPVEIESVSRAEADEFVQKNPALPLTSTHIRQKRSEVVFTRFLEEAWSKLSTNSNSPGVSQQGTEASLQAHSSVPTVEVDRFRKVFTYKGTESSASDWISKNLRSDNSQHEKLVA